ncbi:MAG: hypothetical protein EPO09_07630 [Aquabacterium sp.]|uniref:hypothetical protein n=1 Tax=Aquabacterium sp. TaxID=1872578 RepID=UPI0012276551|nr:hypothetical protein [Aquabacterium sp.]TAK95665.1 MAG: hypothetical protein EPO09_07630 [Aquabacterium sp.]
MRAKLRAIKHIIDCYCAVNDFPLPSLAQGVHVDSLRQPKPSKDAQIRQAIGYHFACDEVSVSVLYDACSLLNEKH